MMGGMEDDELSEIDLTEDEVDAMMAAGEPVEVVGPTDPDRRPRFQLYRDASSRYRWRLVSAAGEVLAASEAYRTKREALRAVDAVARAVALAGRVDLTHAS